MSTIASLILSFVLTIAASITGLVPGNNPSETAKQTGKTVSEIATNQATPSAQIQTEPIATTSANLNNFGSWVSSLTPDEPKADGQAFGEKVSTAAQIKNDTEETDENPNGNDDTNTENPPIPTDPPSYPDLCDPIILRGVINHTSKPLLPKLPCVQ